MNQTLGPYTLLRRLAVGGMAEIYVAKAQGLGGFEKLVAVKVIHPQFAKKSSFIRMLIEEAKLCVLLTHRNIGQVFDLGCVDDTYFIVMEYIQGADCAKILRRARETKTRVPIDIAMFIAYEVAQGLHFAHTKSNLSGEALHIVHRDVSPQNILISRQGEVKVVDFGIAKAALRNEITGTGVIKGKFSYMAPEQASGMPASIASDIFSNTAVLYELLTSKNIYHNTAEILLFEKARDGEIEDIQKLRPDLPTSLVDIVRRGLKKDPHERFASAAEFSSALHACAEACALRLEPARLVTFLDALLGTAQNDVMSERVIDAAELRMQRDFSILAEKTLFDKVPTQTSLSAPALDASHKSSRRKEPTTLRPTAIGPRAKGKIEGSFSPTSTRRRADSGLSTAKIAIAPNRRDTARTLPPVSGTKPDLAPPLLPRIADARQHAPPLFWPLSDPPSPSAETFASSKFFQVKGLRMSLTQRLKRFGPWAVFFGMICWGAYAWILHQNMPASDPYFEVITVPVGAEVWIDGVRQPGVAPLRLRAPLKVHTEHLLEVRLPGYERWSKRFTHSSKRVTEIVTLRPEKRCIEVITQPDGAQIWVNSELRGTAPVDIYLTHHDQVVALRASLSGYRDETRKLTWHADHTRQRMLIKLRPERSRD